MAPPRPVDSSAVAPILRVGADWVGLLPYAVLDPERHEVLYDRERQWWGERPEGVVATAEFAREAGLKIMVKPHLWIRGEGWVGEYAPVTEEGWHRWEATYTDYVVGLAVLADSLSVELFVVGTELDETVRTLGPHEGIVEVVEEEKVELVGISER